MMFALLMVPLVVTGSWCEKMTFRDYLIFIILWPIVCYYLAVHWAWSPDGFHFPRGILDFAGGIIIHTNAGVARLVVSKRLQKQKLHQKELVHHNLPLAFIGAAILWGGWYSLFNGGSALKANAQAASALLNMHMSACAGSLMWSLRSFFRSTNKKWSLLDFVSGAFAGGLAAITPGSGFVDADMALVIGICAGTAGYWSVKFFKGYLKLDDVLDVTSLQGTAGCLLG